MPVTRAATSFTTRAVLTSFHVTACSIGRSYPLNVLQIQANSSTVRQDRCDRLSHSISMSTASCTLPWVARCRRGHLLHHTAGLDIMIFIVPGPPNTLEGPPTVWEPTSSSRTLLAIIRASITHLRFSCGGQLPRHSSPCRCRQNQ